MLSSQRRQLAGDLDEALAPRRDRRAYGSPAPSQPSGLTPLPRRHGRRPAQVQASPCRAAPWQGCDLEAPRRPTIGRGLTQNLPRLATVVCDRFFACFSDRSLDPSDAIRRRRHSPRGTGWFRKQVGKPAAGRYGKRALRARAPWISNRSRACFAASWQRVEESERRYSEALDELHARLDQLSQTTDAARDERRARRCRDASTGCTIR